MTRQTEIKTLNDGSINYAHYINKSHAIRSNDAHQALAAIWRLLGTEWTEFKLHLVLRPRPNQSKGAQRQHTRTPQALPVLRVGQSSRGLAGARKAAKTVELHLG